MAIGTKTKNSIRNIFFGVILKVFQIVISFVIRTILIYYLGMEYAGLNSLFTSILQVLNIAELGVGYAMTVSMYKPISEGNENKLCALIRLYRKYYRIIGLIILVVGLAITPLLPYLISGEIPENINLYIIYYLDLGATVFSYWLFAYRSSLLAANQRDDIISKVTLCILILKSTLQIVSLILTRSYYSYLIINLSFQLINNIVIAIVSKKLYPTIVCGGTLDKEELKTLNRQIRDLFSAQFGMTITLSVDSIVISAFLGLVPLGIYQNYYYIVSTIMVFFTVFYRAVRASIGTNLIEKSADENYKDYKYITFVVCFLLAFSISCLICMYQTFITIWVGEENLLDNYCVILLGIYLLVYELCLLISSYKDFSGIWHADRFRPLVTAIVNLVLNIVLVNFMGIYGILISTIVSYLFVNIPWAYHRVFIDIFERKYFKDYLFELVKNVLLIVAIAASCYAVCFFISLQNLYMELLIKFFIAAAISTIVFSLLNIHNGNMKKTFYVCKNFIERK